MNNRKILRSNITYIPSVGEQIMGVYKIIDIVGTSEKSFSDAADNAIKEVAKTIKHIKRAEITKMDVKVVNDNVTQYRAELNISFEIER